MSYAAEADLVERFGETEIILLSNDANADTVNSDVVARILADVDNVINGYIGNRYTLPLTAVPDSLLSIACDLAHYRLATRNGSSRATDTVKDRNDDALRQLRDVASGKFSLGLTSGGAPVPSSNVAQYAKPERDFTRESLRDFTPLRGTRRRWPAE